MHTRAQNEPNVSPLLARVDVLRSELRSRDPQILAQKTGAQFTPSGPGAGVFSLKLWDREVKLSFPELDAQTPEGQPGLIPPELALLFYYFYTADGAPLARQWISFSDLPDGRFYNQAFQGYTGRELARAYGQAPDQFEQAALCLGGSREDFGDLAFRFPVLPHVAFLAVLWLGDEDFPSSCQILFDSACAHSLPTDALAVGGSLLTRKLIKCLDGSSGG